MIWSIGSDQDQILGSNLIFSDQIQIDKIWSWSRGRSNIDVIDKNEINKHRNARKKLHNKKKLPYE